jgi:hypothetical protein
MILKPEDLSRLFVLEEAAFWKSITRAGCNVVLSQKNEKTRAQGSDPWDWRGIDASTSASFYPFFLFLLAHFGLVFEASSALIGPLSISQRSGTESSNLVSDVYYSSIRPWRSSRSAWQRGQQTAMVFASASFASWRRLFVS